MCSNHQDLKILSILIMSADSIRHSMGLSKHQEHGMNALMDFLLKQGFEIGKANTTLFTRKIKNDIFVCQIYVDDIILGYLNSDYAGCKVDQKSTLGTCQFLGLSLVSLSSKKQN